MKVTPLELSGLLLLEPRVFPDERGFFLETWQRPRFEAAGLEVDFVQDNHSRSGRGTLRGLHYQQTPGQGKLVRAARGSILDVVVDLRPESPTFGRWQAQQLDDVTHLQLWIPVGFAHGFCVLSEVADVTYKVTSPYDPAMERSLRWDDPDLGIDWGLDAPLVSARDRQAESFASFRERIGR